MRVDTHISGVGRSSRRSKINVNSQRCDVLIVGGGLTALRAAVEARQAGASVIVVCKRKVGRSGSSAFTAGGFAAVVENDDRWGLHFRDTWLGGARIGSTALVRVLCREAAVRLAELEKNGIRFQKVQNRYRVFSSGDHNRARIAMPARKGGTRMTLPLRDWAESLGCKFFENIVVTDLLKDGDRVVGAIGLHRKEGSLWSIQAGATILATGGAGQIFSVTSNPPDVTGDGYALALRAGARLRDMERLWFDRKEGSVG